MKEFIHQLKDRVLEGYLVTREDAAKLLSISIEKEEELKELLQAANEIREKFCGNFFNLCTILNAKSGRCSENCRYCAQSAHFKTNADVYPLVSKEVALEAAKEVEVEGAHRFSLVTSGRGLQGKEEELDKLQEIYRYLKENTDLDLCASHGICSKEALQKLKDAGVKTYHHNLESSRRFYPTICTSHTFDDRVNTVKYAHEVGLQVCSGGIFGLGETEEDRIDMAFDLRELKVHSVPINILTPIPGTPLENNKEIDPKELLKDIAIYRFILPKVSIRYAGGRVKLGEYAKLGLEGGVNSALTGNFLTTTGNTIESDKKMIKELGYEY
ncbi:biotin synthase BioB [Fusobacterium gonidiaformans]|uniref:biotin synthase BioB n=1 Tax=Fusobacterium gonidiaformans TaxID=849 RepID=UPI0001BC63EF|nr:biotin synthase BioB [Fusobacterium gonidiaformans]AVQ17345.1 biotin synthase BioB [Fusobacterium gonidiaformans ATCC 25563]EFS27881.1 biotin synthase [Fusobacterium gonidiaformans ATCC 25563]